MCENYDIKAKPTISHNPQANAMIERIHKVMNDMLRSFDLENENLEEDNPFNYILQFTAWAIRSTYPCLVETRWIIVHSKQIGIESKNRNRTLLISPIRKIIKTEFIMNTRWETKYYWKPQESYVSYLHHVKDHVQSPKYIKTGQSKFKKELNPRG
jgi:hypothetical protein